MRKATVSLLMAGVALPAYAADLTGGYVPPAGDVVYAPQSMVTGHLQLGLGYGETDFDFGRGGFSEDYWIFEGAGRANIDFGTFNLEIETGGNSLIFDDGFSSSTIGAAAHLWGRFNNAALGVFGAANFPTSTSIYTLGVEGEVYFGAITLGADASYNWFDSFFDDEFWKVRGWADFYLTPDARIGGKLSYLSFNDFDVDAWSATIDGEYRFSGTPFSLWAEGNYQSADLEFGDQETWSGLIGFRVFMDAPGTTLQGHDRSVPWDGGLLDTNFSSLGPLGPIIMVVP
jgi:hypothetical protein